MKNKIFIIVAIVFSFLITDNVKASNEYVLGVLETDSDAYNFIADTNNLPSTILEHIFIGNKGGNSYSTSDDYVYLLTFAEKYRPYIASASGYSYFSLFDDEKNIYTNTNTSDFEDIDVYYLAYDSENNTYSWVLQDSVQIIFYYYGASALTSKYFYSTEYYKSDLTTVSNEANIELSPKIPTINLSLEDSSFDDEGNVIQKTISVDWGIKDTSKYSYMYTNFDGVWFHDISEDAIFNIEVNYNTTYRFQILDIDGNYIDGNSITIADLTEKIPYILFENLEEEECIIYSGNEKYQICDNISVTAKNIDFSKYKFEYTFDHETWYEYNSVSKKKISIDKNGTFTARIVSLVDGSYIDGISYTVTSITTPNDGKPLPIMNLECNPDLSYNMLILKIYNYDDTLYDYYYKFDYDEEFELIEFKKSDTFYYSEFYLFHDNLNVFVKITDKEGKYIDGTALTYTGDMCSLNESKNKNFYESVESIEALLNSDDVTNSDFFANILLTIYDSAPPRFLAILKIFLTLTFIGIVFIVMGWK